MKPELWLNRASHELSLAQELLDAGSLLWAVSYAHRSVEYALEGLIVLKTSIRPEKGSRIEELHAQSRGYLPEDVNNAVSDLSGLTPIVWQSDLTGDQIKTLTDPRARTLISGAEKTVAFIGEEWKKDNPMTEDGSHPS